jgi:hypothetical protein
MGILNNAGDLIDLRLQNTKTNQLNMFCFLFKLNLSYLSSHVLQNIVNLLLIILNINKINYYLIEYE